MAITGQVRRRRIVINADAYISSATSNVPVLIKFNSTDHPDIFATGDTKNSVWFSTDAGGNNTLYHEGVVFDATNAIFYVKVDLSSTADTTIYFWYGTPSITGTESKTNVWANGAAIYHFEGNANDTMGNYNGTSYNVSYSTSYGLVGQGARFNGSSGTYISIGGSLSVAIPFTAMVWGSYSADRQGVLTGGTGTPYIFFFYDGGTCRYYAPNSAYCYHTHGLTKTNMNLWVQKRTSTGNNMKFQYNNGNEFTPTFSGTLSDEDNNIGRVSGHSTSYYWNGNLDNLWIFTDTKSNDFIKAVYNNVKNYSTFVTIDGAVTIGSSPKMVCPIWAVSGSIPYDESVAFGIGLAISVSTQTNYNRSVDFGIGLAISVQKEGELQQSVNFGIGLGIEVSTQTNFNREVNFGIGLGITVTTQSTFHRTVDFGIGLGIDIPIKKDWERAVNFGIGISIGVTHQVYTDLDNFKIEKITVTKNIQDAMWQGNVYIDNTTIPPYYRHLRIYMEDHTATKNLVFLGFFPNADYTYAVANNKTRMTSYDYGWYLSAQYVPNDYRITNENTNPAEIITALLGGNDWEKVTGIEPYNIDTVSGWGTTITKKSFVFDKKTTKKQAIDEICSHCNFIFVLKWRITVDGHTRPCAYFINEDDIDTDLDLPPKVTFASGNNYLKEDIKIEDRQNEKINRVRVAGANAVTGDWYEAVVESAGVTSGDEIAIEYYTESSSLDTQAKVDAKALALFNFFNTVAKTYSATLINRTDLQLYQLVNFTGYSYIDTEDMRIIGITYNDLGTHREVNIQFTSNQALSDLKALNRSMGGDSYNNTTNILNHYFIDLTKIAVGTITAIDGNSATIELEDGSGFVTARLINQDE